MVGMIIVVRVYAVPSPMHYPVPVAVLAAVLCSPALANAQDEGQPAAGADAPPADRLPPPTAELSLSGQHNFASDFSDAEGEVAVSRAAADVGMTFATSQRGRLTVGLGAERSMYSFDNATGFVSGSDEPWDDIMTAQASLRFSRQHDGAWSYFAGVDITSSAQDSAEFSDSLTYGGAVGVMYGESRSLRYGVALGVHTRLEDDASVFPIPIVAWQFDERWTLASGPRRGGGQVSLSYKAMDELELSLNVGFESRDFRLASDAPVTNGVGRDSRLPVSVAAKWKVHPQVTVSAEAGANFNQEFTLDDESGNRVNKLDADMGFFAGVGVTVSF